MLSQSRDRLSYHAWAVSLAIHLAMVGAVLLASTQMNPLSKEEIFHWDIALTQPSLDSLPTQPQPAPTVQPLKPAPVRTVQTPQPVEPAADMGMTRVAAQYSPQVVHPTILPPQPDPEMGEAKTKPAEPQEITKEEPRKESVKPQDVVKPEPVGEIAQAKVQSVESAATAQANETPAPARVHHTESTPVIHHESPSPEEMAPEWRPLVAVGERPGKTASESVASAPVPAQSNAMAAAPFQAGSQPDSPVPSVAKAAPVRPATKADNAWLAESLGRRIKELTRYPNSARLNGSEGKVVLRVVLRADGHLSDVTVHRSSGHEVLDRAAMETVRLACPIHMKQALSAAEVAVYVPIVYSLAG